MTKREIIESLAGYGIEVEGKKTKSELEELLAEAENAVNININNNNSEETGEYVLLYRIKGVERRLAMNSVDDAVKYARTHGYNDITIKKA